MDPLSILGTAITLAGVILATTNQLQQLLNAPQELIDLVDEVQNVRQLLEDSQNVLAERHKHQNTGLPQHAVDAGSSIAVQIKKQLERLDETLSHCFPASRKQQDSGKRKIAYMTWLRARGDIKSIQQNLLSGRLSLCSIWGVIQVSDSTSLHLSIQEMTHLNRSQLLYMSQQTRAIELIAETIKSQNPVHQEADKLMYSSSSSSSSEIIQRPNTYPKYHTRCAKWCSCRCHHETAIQSPGKFALLVGNLLVSYSGFQFQAPKCTERACRRQSTPTVRISYQFPAWLVPRMLYLGVSLSGMKGPEMTLSMPRTISPSAAVFTYAVSGNLEKIQQLFSRGLASPYDTAANTGRTVLHYAANYNHPKLTRFLLENGANPSIRDTDNETSVSLVWKRIFGAYFTTTRESDLWTEILYDEDYLDSRGFPPLHRALLKLSTTIALHQQLSLDTSGIDTPDADGHTVLSWAAARGDDNAVSLLLHSGADPNKSNHRGQTPLHMAARSHSPHTPAVIRLLIQAGVDLDPVDFWHRTPLIYASAQPDLDDPKMVVEPLINSGRVNINVQDCRCRTPLGYASLGGRPKTVQFLLENGADPNISANWGYTPLVEAIVSNRHEVLATLLEFHRSRNVSPQKWQGRTIDILGGKNILYLLAENADSRMLRLVRPYIMMFDRTVIDPDTLTEDSITASSVFANRDMDKDTRDSWADLIGAIRSPAESDDESVEVYEDAVESFKEIYS